MQFSTLLLRMRGESPGLADKSTICPARSVDFKLVESLSASSGNLAKLAAMNVRIFDPNGMLANAIHAYVLAWRLTFAEACMPIDSWRLRRPSFSSVSRLLRAPYE